MGKRILASCALLFLSGMIFSFGSGFSARLPVILFSIFYILLTLFLRRRGEGRRLSFFQGIRRPSAGRRALMRKEGLLFILFCSSFLCGFLRGSLAGRQEQALRGRYGKQRSYVVAGQVFRREDKEKTTAYYLKNTEIQGAGPAGTILVYSKEDLPVGSEIILEGKRLDINRRRNEGGFDEASYLRAKEIFLKLAEEEVLSVKQPVFSPGRVLYEAREAVGAFYEAHLPGEESDVLKAMALGDKAGMQAEVKDLFAAAGVAHLLAVSGLHISVIAMGLYKLCRKCSFSFLLSFVISVPAAVLYAAFTGFSVSAVRALIMFTIYLFSQVLGKVYDMVTSATVAAILIFSFRPFAIFDSGAIFSFGAVLAVALAAGPLKTAYDDLVRARHREIRGFEASLPEKLLSSLISSAAVVFGTLPLAASMSYTVPTWQIFLNVLLIPLMSILLPFALAAGALRAPFFLLVPHVIIYFYEWAADASLKLPFSTITTGEPGPVRIVLYLSIYAFSVHLFKKFLLKMKDLQDLAHPRPVEKRLRRRTLPALFALCLLSGLVLKRLPPKEAEFVMLDVGQGDGLYVGTNAGTRIMIDGGSSDENNVGTYTLLPFLRSRGISSVDYWFISHTDNDHLSGCLEALEKGYPVKRLLFAKYVVQNDNFSALTRAAKENGTEVVYMDRRDRLNMGSERITCLYAGLPANLEGTDPDPNKNCMALLYEAAPTGKGEAFSVLLTGDISADEEEIILNDPWAMGLLSRNNITSFCLKAAHHGSNGSNCEDFLQTLSPDLSLCSAGEGNRYGHPGKETVFRMKEASIPFYCTIETGEMRLRRGKDGKVVLQAPFRKDVDEDG